MIVDDLTHVSLYFGLGAGIRTALEYLARVDPASLVVGRHSIDGDRVIVGINDYDTQPEAEGIWEAHRRHIDVQCVFSGEERVGVTPVAAIDASPYDEARDVVFGRGSGDFLTLVPGRFLMLFPQDAHMPGRIAGAVARVRKAVVKIRIEPEATWPVSSRPAVP